MRHTPCGCRSADLVGVQTNFRLTRHYSMRQASAMPHSVGSLPPNATSHAPHDSKARLQNGDETHGFMAKPCTPHLIAQRVQLFKLQTANVGGRGELPSPFSGGFKGGILFGKRIPPLVPRRARRSPSRARAGKSGHPFGKGCKKDPPHLWQVFFELISNNAYCGSYGRPRSSCGA